MSQAGSSTLEAQVARFIAQHRLLAEGECVVVGLSGGVDSMAGIHLLRRLGYAVVAAHVNYGLRAEADADESFVRTWCADQTPPIPVRVAHLDAAARAEAEGSSVQEAARALRYDFLADVADEEGATSVVVAHHRDDQAETVLLNLIRGSGPEGLAGMAPARPVRPGHSVQLVRPMLGVWRSEIEAYAEAQGLPWRTDASNTNLKYRRSAVRTDILPRIEQHFEGASKGIARAAELLRDYVEHTLHPALDDRFARCYEARPEGGWLDLDALRDEPPVWRRRLILEALAQAFAEAPRTFAVARAVEALLPAQVGRRVELGGGIVWRERGGLRLLPADAAPKDVPPTHVPWGEPVALPGGTLAALRLDARPEALDTGTPHRVYADADRLDAPLTVRTWTEGDRFRPLGLDGTKTISDFLTDARVPPHRRAGALVLLTGERIAWVVGHRIDHRVRVRPATTRYAKLTFRPYEKRAHGYHSSA